MDNRAVRKVVMSTLCSEFDRAAGRFRRDPSAAQPYRELMTTMVALRHASNMRPADIAQALGDAHPRNYVRLFSLLAEQD